MTIEERLVRQSPEDILYIGHIVETAYLGEFGRVLNAIIEGLKTREIAYHQTNPTDRQPMSADRILGRIEGYQAVINELDLTISKAKYEKKPIEEEDEFEE